MASGAGRYRSRLFSLLSRASRRWVDRGDRALRHLGVGVTWGTQILLFPVYLMVQAARVAGRQLKQAAQPSEELELPPADKPIQRILETATALSRGGEMENGRAIASGDLPISDREIQGIATSLENRALVLVDSHNQIEDNLTDEQQREIQKLIALEVSDYLHQRILAEEAKAKLINQLPPLEDHPLMLPPIRWFRKVISWVQTGPVASLVNLFQEENLIVNLETRTQQLKLKSQQLKAENQRLELKSQQLLPERKSEALPQFDGAETAEISPTSLIGKIDSALAKLEEENLAVMSKVTTSITHCSLEFLQIVKTRWQESPAIELPKEEIENSQARQFTIQALIKAAIDYFFGWENKDKLSTDRTSTAIGYAPPSIKGNNHHLEEPWLTAEELFATNLKKQPSDVAQNPTPPLKEKILPAAISVAASEIGGISIGEPKVNSSQNYSSITQTTVRQSSRQQKKGKNPPEVNRKPTRSPSSTYHSTSITPKNKSYQKNYQPQALSNEDVDDDAESDWIEIKAKSTGYVKHPLEQILEWLDLAMLWLEELLLKVWHELRQLFTGKR